MKLNYYVVYNRQFGFGYPLRLIFSSCCPPEKALDNFHAVFKPLEGDEVEWFLTFGQCRLFCYKLALETDTNTTNTVISKILESKVECNEN